MSAPGSAVHDAFAIHHGLYWLTVDIATAASGLVLSIDDAHWCDRPTLDWVRYLVRRLDDVPAMVVLASRSGEPSGELDFLDALTVDASALVLRPAPLTAGGVRTFVTEALGATDDEAVGACVDATGGNPFLLGQLVAAALHRDEAEPEALAAAARATTPEEVVRAIVVRLRRLGSDAVELAQSVAVLGVAAQAHHAASLAGLSERRAAVAQDALRTRHADVLTDTAPRAFVHPLVRRAVYEAIPGAERSLLHARAARVLRQAGIPAELVAGQLLACSPAGNSWTVETLRWCAAAVVARAPDAAVHYLERALREPPEPGARSAVLAALGQAELVSGGHGAVEHLRTAVADMRSGREHCAATILLARAVAAGGGMAEAVNWFEQAAEDARTSDSDLARECEIEGMCLGIADPRLGAEALERAHGYVRGRPLDSAGGRTLLGLLAYRAAMDYEHAAEVGDLADAALADGTLAAHADERFLPFTLSTWAGIHADRFDVAAEQAARVLELGRARGRPLLIVGGAHVLCAVRIRQGRVWEAEAHGWDAVRFIETIPVVRGQAVLQLVEALLARGALEEVGRLLVDQGLEGDGLLQSSPTLRSWSAPNGTEQLAGRATRWQT